MKFSSFLPISLGIVQYNTGFIEQVLPQLNGYYFQNLTLSG
jgi:hypothetical protein